MTDILHPFRLSAKQDPLRAASPPVESLWRERGGFGRGEGTFLQKGSLPPPNLPSPSQDFRKGRCRDGKQGGWTSAARLPAMHQKDKRNKASPETSVSGLVCIFMVHHAAGLPPHRLPTSRKSWEWEGWGPGEGGPFWKKGPPSLPRSSSPPPQKITPPTSGANLLQSCIKIT